MSAEEICFVAEIINPQGKVSYRRPVTHPDVKEALATPGYRVRFTEENLDQKGAQG